ncbi:hypothetical protein, partial [Ancrocorticia populi]|uniref:hypothetical protein n=1 Tax=Ancrocorticia populi TaxID=2175228 RepID=UPI003F8E7F07
MIDATIQGEYVRPRSNGAMATPHRLSRISSLDHKQSMTKKGGDSMKKVYSLVAVGAAATLVLSAC